MKIFGRRSLRLGTFLVVARGVDCGCGLEPEAALTRNRDPRSERQWGGGGSSFKLCLLKTRVLKTRTRGLRLGRK